MLSCLSTSYSIGRYYIPDFVPFQFTTTATPDAVIFTNSNNQAPVNINSTSGTNQIWVNNFNQSNFDANRTIYLKFKLNNVSPQVNTTEYILGFIGTATAGGNNLFLIFRNAATPARISMNITANGSSSSVSRSYNFLNATQLVGAIINCFFRIVTSAGITTMEIRMYVPSINNSAPVAYTTANPPEAPFNISTFDDLFPNTSNFNMNYNGTGGGITALCSYYIAGYYNKSLSDTECLTISNANANPT